MRMLNAIGLVLNGIFALALGCFGLMVLLGMFVAVAGGITGDVAIMEIGKMMIRLGIMAGFFVLIGAGDLVSGWPYGNVKTDSSSRQEDRNSTKPTSPQ